MLLHLVHSSLLLNIAIVVKIVKVKVNEDTFDHILYFCLGVGVEVWPDL